MRSSDGLLAFEAWCSFETHANTPSGPVLVNDMQTPQYVPEFVPNSSWSPQITTNVEYKIDHISKTKNRKIFKISVKPFQYIAHLLRQKKYPYC